MKSILKIALAILVVLNLTACQSSWDEEVDLSEEEVQKIESNIDLTKQLIKYQIRKRASGKAEPMAYVELANNYVELGKMKRAERVYKSAIKTGLFSSALYHNLGRLYEKVGEYDMAVEQYQILIDEFSEYNYWYDITWAYIRNSDRLKAEQAFNQWQRKFNKTDQATQEALKKLREEESANVS